MKTFFIAFTGVITLFLAGYQMNKYSETSQPANQLIPAQKAPLTLSSEEYVYPSSYQAAGEAVTELGAEKGATDRQVVHFTGLLELPASSFCFALSGISQADADAFMLYGLSMIKRHPKKAIRYARRLSEFYRLQHPWDEITDLPGRRPASPMHSFNLDTDLAATTDSSFFSFVPDWDWLEILRWGLLLLVGRGIIWLYQSWKRGKLFLHSPRPSFFREGYTAAL